MWSGDVALPREAQEPDSLQNDRSPDGTPSNDDTMEFTVSHGIHQ